MLADRIGRKSVVGMTVFAAFCCYVWSFCVLYFYKTLPFALIYVYPLFLWFGGGGYVAGSIITAIAAEVVPSEDSRTRAFFLLGVISMLVAVAAPPVGARIMHYHGPYVAYGLNIPLSVCAVIPLVLLPETAKGKSLQENTEDDGMIGTPNKASTLRTGWKELKSHVVNDFFPLLKSIPIVIGLLSMVIGSFAVAVGEIIIQYMKARFGWSYEKSTNVIAFSAAMRVLLLCTVLPFAHKQLTKRYETRKADLVLCKLSLPFECICFLVFGLSATPAGAWVAVAIGNFGLGFGGAMRSYMTALVPEHDIALLYTLIGTAGAIGNLFASAVLQLTLAVGIRAGGMLVGLPFFLIASLYGINVLLVWCLRSPPPKAMVDDEPIPSQGDIRI
ncbi:hypothetical protein, variant 1 [Verruconis gallopava]|nr:hypothetical protein, variant 1 [Verruconis gallopava]KIW04569.1 hypothetical protein, variant 1 [Verruconis gallopava]